MEKIASDLKVTELKQSSICKAMEELHSQSSSVLLITLQWKDLQKHLDSTRTKLESLRQELVERENNIGLKEKELEAQRLQICSALELKEKRLNEVDSLIEERSRMIEFNEKHIESLVVLIQENSEELEVKENKFHALNASFGEKEREFDQLKKCVAERKSRLDLLQKIIREAESEAESKAKEVESKGREVEKLRALLRKYRDDIELKERQFNALRRSVEERREQVELKEKEFRVYESAIDECKKDIKLKEEKLTLIQDSIMECTAELQSKEQQLDSVREEVRLKEKHFASLRKSVEEYYKKLEMKKAEFKGLFEELGLKEKALELKLEEVDVLYNKTNEFFKEVELKEKVIDERLNELGAKEKQFESRFKQFVLEKREFEERWLKEKTNMVQVKIEQPDNDPPNNSSSTSSIYQSCVSTSGGGGNLQLLLYQHLKRHDLICSQICANLRASLDPGKLILDAIRGFYPPGGKDKEEDVDLGTVRRSCILLMEQLMTTSPSKISDNVREEARKLAADWKAKLKVETEDQLEVLGFLQLLAVFELSSNFDADELRSLLQIVAHHRQAPVLRHALRIADKAPAEVEQAEDLSGNFATNSAPNFHPSTTKSRRSLHCRNEHLTGNDWADDETLATLQMSEDPPKIMLDMIGRVFIKYWKWPTRVCNANVMKNCISRFDQLMRLSPQIGPSVREDAMKLALEWQVKMRAVPENSFEILCFLQFLATYGLVSSFNTDDILMLLEKISQHKEALELCTTLGFADNIPELVQTLIARKRHLDAVRLICSYKLVDKISPAPLLKEYLDLVKNSARNICKRNKPAGFKAKAREEERAALRSVKQCVIDYNLESCFPLTNIDTRLDLLEKIEKERSWTPSHASKPRVAPQQMKQNARTFDHNEQQQQQQNRNKCPRIAMCVSSGGPRGSSVVCTPVFPQVSSSNLHGASMPANSHWQYGGFSASLGAGQNAGLRYSFDTLSKHY
ncbi:FRIGIDA-like protein 5 [Ziziphus jujuba]|uniref:FRIGIDA-like protein n=1 Tax=Ziziphus jujuba TaxID=326968 RepID=A0ABM3IB94_ZIZJJ|nr:FRIGIDA-like protein 5 [Ziziphus jujuba]